MEGSVEPGAVESSVGNGVNDPAGDGLPARCNCRDLQFCLNASAR